MRDFKIIGHRGACAHEPENTLRSIRRAIADGAKMVEIDVRYVAGEILVIHDDTVDRTTDGKGAVHKMSFAEVRELDAGMGEKVPTLAEVIETVRGKCALNIEIKEEEAVAAVCGLLGELGDAGSDDFLISSSDSGTLGEARARLPEAAIGIIVGMVKGRFGGVFRLAERLQVASIHPQLRWASPAFVEEAHDRGFKVYPFTVRTREELVKILDSGADGCFADDPKWTAGLVEALE
ncbi:MAG: glycerophosphodiester phosphodiesterase family protein [Luteolibacter sp.]